MHHLNLIQSYAIKSKLENSKFEINNIVDKIIIFSDISEEMDKTQSKLIRLLNESSIIKNARKDSNKPQVLNHSHIHSKTYK